MTRLLIPVELIEVGCSVWAHEIEKTDAETRQIRGGTVIQISTHVDAETGEVSRKFHTATPWRGGVRFDELAAGDVEQVEPPNAAWIRSLMRSAAAVVQKSKRTSSDVARCIALQAQLMEVL